MRTPDLGVRLAVDGHRGREPVVDTGERPGQIVPLNLRHQVLECTGLMAQGVPVLFGDLDADLQHPVHGEVSVAGVRILSRRFRCRRNSWLGRRWPCRRRWRCWFCGGRYGWLRLGRCRWRSRWRRGGRGRSRLRVRAAGNNKECQHKHCQHPRHHQGTTHWGFSPNFWVQPSCSVPARCDSRLTVAVRSFPGLRRAGVFANRDPPPT